MRNLIHDKFPNIKLFSPNLYALNYKIKSHIICDNRDTHIPASATAWDKLQRHQLSSHVVLYNLTHSINVGYIIFQTVLRELNFLQRLIPHSLHWTLIYKAYYFELQESLVEKGFKSKHPHGDFIVFLTC